MHHHRDGLGALGKYWFVVMMTGAVAAVMAACGGGGGGSQAASQPQLTVLAGKPGGPGTVDGVGAEARFMDCAGLASDNLGNVYCPQSYGGTLRKISPDGVVTTIALHTDQGAPDSLLEPSAVAVDSAGNIYVTERGPSVVRKITTSGVITTLAGARFQTGSADGVGESARFNRPEAIAVDGAGLVYVADSYNMTIRRITPGGQVTTVAGVAGTQGFVDGQGSGAQFVDLTAMTSDSAGNLYVIDKHAIRKVAKDGVVTTIAGVPDEPGGNNGPGSQARFQWPQGIACDPLGRLYVADRYNHAIRMVDAAGNVSTLAGMIGVRGYVDGQPALVRFAFPRKIARAPDGGIYVFDDNHVLRRLTSDGFAQTVAGSPEGSGFLDGRGEGARFSSPLGIAADAAGNVFVADWGNSGVRKIQSNGAVSTLARFDSWLGQPIAVAVDEAGVAYVAESYHGAILKIAPSGEITTWAGFSPHYPADSDMSPSSPRQSVSGIAVASRNNVFITESSTAVVILGILYSNSVSHLTTSGLVQRAGISGFEGIGAKDGPGASATFNSPTGVAVDAAGNAYVADTGNHTIRKIDKDWNVTTLAGKAGTSGSVDGPGSEARFYEPRGIAVDPDGNLYVADTGNSTVRKISPDGTVSTVVGVAGQIGFRGGNLPGVLDRPFGVAVKGDTLFILAGDAVLKVSPRP